MRSRKKRNIIIGSLACLLVFMGVGYAILSATLNIRGTSVFEGSWDIVITNVAMTTSGNGVTGTYSDLSNDNKNLTLTAELQKPKDEVVYTITVKNQGTVDASLKAVNLKTTNGNAYIEAVNNAELGTALFAGQSMTFDVRIRFRNIDITSLPESLTAKYEFSLTYIQYTENYLQKGDTELAANSAFTISSDGVIWDYDERGGEYVTIPETVDGIKVTEISNPIFYVGNVIYFGSLKNATYVADGSETSNRGYIIKDEENFDAIKEILAVEKPDVTNYYHLNEIIIPGVDDNNEAFLVQKFNVDIKNKTVTGPSGLNKQKIKYLNLYNLDMPTVYSNEFADLGLEEIVFPKNLETISDHAFEGNNFKNLVIPATVKSIEENAFSGMNMKNVQILNNNLNICDYSNSAYGIFNNSTIETLVLGTKNACSGAAKIKNLRLLDSVETVSGFSNNTIESLTLSKNITKIGGSAFYGNKLTSLTIPSSVKTIDIYAFRDNLLESISISEGLETLGAGAFENNKLSSIILPKSIKKIENNVFKGNTSVVDVTLKGKSSASDLTLSSGATENANFIYELS